MKNFSAFIGGFILGAAVGSIVALLNAPYRGDETRDLLVKRSQEYRRLAEEKMAEGQRAVQDRLVKASDRVAATMEEGSEKLKKASGKIAERVEEGSEKLEETAEEVRKAVPKPEES